jgi:hypothetical protein
VLGQMRACRGVVTVAGGCRGQNERQAFV